MREWLNRAVSKTVVPLSGTVGSNPTLSAIMRPVDYGPCDRYGARFLVPRRTGWSVIENFREWKGAGVVELAALEMLCALSGTVGSNPTLSAI